MPKEKRTYIDGKIYTITRICGLREIDMKKIRLIRKLKVLLKKNVFWLNNDNWQKD